MSYGSNEAVEAQEKNQKGYTKKCSYCCENYKVTTDDYKESVYCLDCQNKLYSKDD